MVGAVSEVAVVDLEVVVAGAKKLWGDSWRGDFPTRGSRGLNFGEVSRRAHDTESSRPRAFLATDVNPWLHKKYKCVVYDAELTIIVKPREFGDGTPNLPAGAMGFNPMAGSLRLRCFSSNPHLQSVHYPEEKTTR